jgi:hypothetical protein
MVTSGRESTTGRAAGASTTRCRRAIERALVGWGRLPAEAAMKVWPWLAVLAACGGGDGDATGDAAGDADTDVDSDTDADTDTDTDIDPEAPLECLDAACAGSVVGKWVILGQCYDDPRLAEIEGECPGIAVTLYGLGGDGTVQFGASGQYNFDAGGTTGIGIVVPPECNTGCLTYELPDLGVTCITTGPGGCECTGAPGTSGWYDAGTFTEDNGAVELLSTSSGGSRAIEACVDGTVIWLYDPNRDVSISGVLRTDPS